MGVVQKEEDGWWSLDKVETFYTECCAGREEVANPNVSAALHVRVPTILHPSNLPERTHCLFSMPGPPPPAQSTFLVYSSRPMLLLHSLTS